MGSTLLTIRTLMENQINVGQTSTSSTPVTSTLLNNYINTSIRRITRRDRPREYMSATPTNADITVNTNTVSIPSAIFVPDKVYYSDSGGAFKRLRYKEFDALIEVPFANRFFDTTDVGDPDFYSVRGTSIVTDVHFARTATDAIKFYGVGFPTTLAQDSDSIELPVDYDLLIVYEACILYYQREDDTINQQKFFQQAEFERSQLKMSLDTNDEAEIRLDPYIFNSFTSFRNPNIFFSS